MSRDSEGKQQSATVRISLSPPKTNRQVQEVDQDHAPPNDVGRNPFLIQFAAHKVKGGEDRKEEDAERVSLQALRDPRALEQLLLDFVAVAVQGEVVRAIPEVGVEREKEDEEGSRGLRLLEVVEKDDGEDDTAGV